MFSLRELNQIICASLDKKIFWTGFKEDAKSTDLFSQIGWFGESGRDFIQFSVSYHKLVSSDPQTIAEEITSEWIKRQPA